MSAGVSAFPSASALTRSRRRSPGFNTVTRTGVELLVGQTATINLQMAPRRVPETVTVTGAGAAHRNHDRRVSAATSIRGRCTELPSQGRNWMSLALLAPGNRTNAQGALPVQDRGDVREFQLNVDGLQVTSNLGTGNQSRYSNDAIAEFQFISNRFDATQGRSSGVQVNAITKSGTNKLCRIVRRQLPGQRLERGRSGAERGCCRTRTSRSAGRSAVRSCRTSCTSSATTNTSTSR